MSKHYSRSNGDINDRHIFMTGGTGVLGRTIIDYFHELYPAKNFKLTVLTRNKARFLARFPRYDKISWLDFVDGDLADLPNLNIQCDDFIHGAADAHSEDGGVQWVNQIVDGTRKALDFAVKKKINRFLFVSSGAVYGPQPDGILHFDEDYLGAPQTNLMSSVYGQSKRMAEQLCTIYGHEYGLETVTARLFAFGGVHIPFNGPYAIGNFVRDALNSPEIIIKGDGTAVRSYLDGEDVAEWMVGLLYNGLPGHAYNVGSHHGLSIQELAKVVVAELAPGKRIIIESTTSNAGVRSRYIPSVAKCNSIGLTENYSIKSIVRRMVNRGLHAPSIKSVNWKK